MRVANHPQWKFLQETKHHNSCRKDAKNFYDDSKDRRIKD